MTSRRSARLDHEVAAALKNHYIDDAYPSPAAQERAIEAGTRGRCPLRDLELALREALAADTKDGRRA